MDEPDVCLQEGYGSEAEKALRHQVEQLQAELRSTRESFPYRVLNLLWRLSLKLRIHKVLDFFRNGKQRRLTAKCPAPEQPPMEFDFTNCLKIYEYRYLRYREARDERYPFLFSDVQTPHIPGRVSVILPVYNGGAFLAGSIESVLAQTYADFELIIVNDGSTDDSSAIFEAYARQDARIRLAHQENQKLPRALSNGFKLARGEFLTWTSADNLMAPDFLESLVAELVRHPETGMVYANIELIDGDGAPILDNKWYPQPDSPQTVLLPDCMLALNTHPRNYIGAAFLYRTAVAQALEEYSDIRFTMEDVDYWMRVNEVFNLRHVSFRRPIYQYRFHADSLTGHRKELKIAENRYRLMRWDDFRRKFLLRPLCWKLGGIDPEDERFAGFFAGMRQAGHRVIEDDAEQADLCQSDYTSTIYMAFAGVAKEPTRLPEGCYKIYVAPRPVEAPPPGWDCYVSLAPVSAEDFIGGHKGWFSFGSGSAMFAFLDIRAKNHFLARMERTATLPRQYEKKYTCVVAHNRGADKLKATLACLAKLSCEKGAYEIIVVASESERAAAPAILEEVAEREALPPNMLRIVFSPAEDVAECHNIAAWAAKGERMAFFASGAVCGEDYLQIADLAWSFHPEVAAVCGRMYDGALPYSDEERFTVKSSMDGYASCGCVCCKTSELLLFGGFHVHENGGSTSFPGSGWELSLLYHLVAQGRLILDTNALCQRFAEREPTTREAMLANMMNRYELENLGLVKFESYPDEIRARIQRIREKAFLKGDNALTEEELDAKWAHEQLWETVCKDLGVRCSPDGVRSRYTAYWKSARGEQKI